MNTKGLLIVLLIANAVIGRAQDKDSRINSNFRLSAGPFIERTRGSSASGAGVLFSYGLDISLSENLSITPSLGAGALLEDAVHIGWKGNESGVIYPAFAAVAFNFRVQIGTMQLFLGIAPTLSVIMDGPEYHDGSSPSNPLNGKPKFRTSYFSVCPSITIQPREHWYFGLEQGVGLTNIMKQYPEYGRTGEEYFYTTMIVCGWRF